MHITSQSTVDTHMHMHIPVFHCIYLLVSLSVMTNCALCTKLMYELHRKPHFKA